MKFVDEINPSV